MIRCIVKQAISLYGVVYKVGRRDIPAGHACGDDWDSFVRSGWITLLDKLPDIVETVVNVVSGVEVFEVEPEAVESESADVESVFDEPEVESEAETESASKSKRKGK